MTLARWMAIALLAAAPAIASAQERSQPIAPSTPDAASPSPHYESAFDSYLQRAEDKETPDKLWRAANDEMGRLGGHVGHMKPTADSTSDDPETERATVLPKAEQTHADHGSHGMDHTRKGK